MRFLESAPRRRVSRRRNAVKQGPQAKFGATSLGRVRLTVFAVGRLLWVGGFAGSGPVNGFRGRPPMDLAPLSKSNIAPSTAEPLACRSMDSARSARPPGARVRRTPVTAMVGPSVFGARRRYGAPLGQTWLPVSETLVLGRVFDLPEEKPETGPVPAKRTWYKRRAEVRHQRP
jgi:hypothetical protein